MVTGVETAGLILGSIPLLIEGLKTYKKGIGAVKRSVNYDPSLRKLIRQVEGQKLFFGDNLQKLLIGACPGSEDPIELGNDFWTEISTGAVNQAVKDYLGEEKQQYFHDLLDEFELYYVKLGNALNHVQRAGKSDSRKNHLTLSDLNDLAKVRETTGRHVWKRVQYLIKEQDIKDLVKDLEGLNSDMDQLMKNAAILAQYKNIQESRIISDERHAKSLALLLYQIRNYADRLFHALLSAWIPGCHASHDVALFLDTPTVLKPGHLCTTSLFMFRMMICGKPADVSRSPSWHEASVTVFEKDDVAVTQGK
ncbi:hypothetical protein N0V90_005274 [Kalmusia sp. IMI 367209]|nr:hypothetical protein N0V90_005274 [Kalmusia sp. IMI 367209]